MVYLEVVVKKMVMITLLWGFSFGSMTNLMASTLTDKDDQAEQMTMDSQVEEVEGYSYDDYATQTNIETSQLNKDITGLKEKISRLKSQKLEAEKRAHRSTESFKMTKQEKFAAEKQAKRFEQLLNKEQRQVAILERKLDKIKSQKAKAEDRSKKARESLGTVEQQKRELLKQQKDLSTSLQKEMRTKKSLDKKRVNTQSQVYRLKSNVVKLQAQNERLQSQNQERLMLAQGRHKKTYTARSENTNLSLQ
jgi:chromosome segregation ATPase